MHRARGQEVRKQKLGNFSKPHSNVLDLSPVCLSPPPEMIKYLLYVIYSKPVASPLHPSLPSWPVIAISGVELDWIIEQWTEDSWKDWLPERSRGLMLNTNLQKLWKKATNSSIFTVSSHHCTLREEEGCALPSLYECTVDPNKEIRLWLFWRTDMVFPMLIWC